jgi:hypothetical protein
MQGGLQEGTAEKVMGDDGWREQHDAAIPPPLLPTKR